jgi:phosphoribosylaminoimidazolecarboxamide formyltransferase / IMP cyclohydrolase
MAINKVQTIDDRVPVRTVLASVWDKRGLDDLVRALLAANPDIRILSTGGTWTALASLLGTAASRSLRQVSDYTGQPEMQGGLVKTLDFKIYLGLLSETYNPAHREDLDRTGALPIDMVVVNLYPFRETIARPGATLEDARGNIDIGGPCMVRAAAKNFHRVAVLTDPADYAPVSAELAKDGTLGLDTRFALARKAFRLTALYDTAVAEYLSSAPPAALRSPYTVKAGGGDAAKTGGGDAAKTRGG